MRTDTANKLASAASKITAKDLKGSGAKTEFLQFRVSKSEKDSVQATAAALHLQVSEYMMKLHELVAEKLNKK